MRRLAVSSRRRFYCRGRDGVAAERRHANESPYRFEHRLGSSAAAAACALIARRRRRRRKKELARTCCAAPAIRGVEWLEAAARRGALVARLMCAGAAAAAA